MIFYEYTSGLVTIFTKLGNYVCREGNSYACNTLIGYGERGESDVVGFGEREERNDGCVCVEGKEGRQHS